MDKRPIAAIAMENGSEIIIALYPDEAPNTVSSFVFLANRGFFDGHAIQRIVPGYVVDVSFNAFGHDECKYLIENESRSCGFPNNIRVEPGVIAMGGYGENGIAGAEFFFPLEYHEKLDGNYPAFGKIIEGLETILSWGKLPLRKIEYPGGNAAIEANEPLDPLVIKSVRVDTFGAVYPEPRKRAAAYVPPGW